jgi:hypothetical protein
MGCGSASQDNGRHRQYHSCRFQATVGQLPGIPAQDLLCHTQLWPCSGPNPPLMTWHSYAYAEHPPSLRVSGSVTRNHATIAMRTTLSEVHAKHLGNTTHVYTAHVCRCHPEHRAWRHESADSAGLCPRRCSAHQTMPHSHDTWAMQPYKQTATLTGGEWVHSKASVPHTVYAGRRGLQKDMHSLKAHTAVVPCHNLMCWRRKPCICFCLLSTAHHHCSCSPHDGAQASMHKAWHRTQCNTVSCSHTLCQCASSWPATAPRAVQKPQQPGSGADAQGPQQHQGC